MKKTGFYILFLFSITAAAQKNSAITIVDFVKITNNKSQEALYFYENNWKVYRAIALKANFIKSYKLLQMSADSVGDFDLMLMTEYADSVQYKLSEERFQKIIKERSPKGPSLLNDLKPNDFRKNVFFKKANTISSSQ